MSSVYDDPRVIASARICPPLTFGEPARVYVTIDGDTPDEIDQLWENPERCLFSYFVDEIKFHESELVGKTIGQIMALRHAKDLAYLRS